MTDEDINRIFGRLPSQESMDAEAKQPEAPKPGVIVWIVTALATLVLTLAWRAIG